MTLNTIPEKAEEEKDKKKAETEDERKKRIGYPSHNIDKLFKEIDLEE